MMQQVRNRIMENPVLNRIRSALSDETFPPLYLVGGALRDGWLGREIRDFDFVVAGDARTTASRLAVLLDARYVLLDEDWGVARLIWSAPGRKEDPVWLDFVSMRGESLQEDLRQRDFTCNAMGVRIGEKDEPDAGWLEDPTGGLRDLRKRLIRMVHPQRLREDPLRLLRALRLACTLGFQIEGLTLKAIGSQSQGILSVAPERVRDELFKLLACPESLAWIVRMEETGLLTTILPEMEGLKGLEQGKFHHLDAWNHTLEAYRILEEGCREGFEPMLAYEGDFRTWCGAQREVLPLVKAALLLHDTGKPLTATFDEAREPHFYGHAGKGAEISAAAMRRLRASRNDEEKVRKWVRYHMGPLHMMRAMQTDHLTERAKIRFLRRLGSDAPGIFLLSIADFLASAGPSATSERNELFCSLLNSLLELYFRRDAASIRGNRLVTGRELIDALGIPPGPTVGRLLRRLEEARVEGKVSDRAEALRLAGSLLDEMRTGKRTKS